ncbi:MAG: hypothetical protein ACAI34_17290 [Verrucomicrobium sp.]|nr:hypothetical protein [Verrucomicrobium sp.]
MKTRKKPTGATLSVDSVAAPMAKLTTSGRSSTSNNLVATLARGSKRSGATSRTPRVRSTPTLRGVSVTFQPARALTAVHYAAVTSDRLLHLKEKTVGQAAYGRLVISQSQVRTRLREMLLLETGYDLDDLPEDGVFPTRLSQNTRVGLQLPLQSTYFCEVKCRVGVKALQAASTPNQLVDAVWAAIPLAHRSPSVG